MKNRFPRIRLHSKIFLVFSALMVLSLFVACVTIISMSTNLYIKEAEETGRRDLALITNSIELTLQRLSNTAVSIASDSRVIATAKRYPNAPNTETEKALLRSGLGLNIGTIIGTSSDIYMWDMFSLSGAPFGMSGYDLSKLSVQLDESFFQEAASILRMRVSGVQYYTLVREIGNVPVFLATKLIVDLNTRKPLAVLVLIMRESRISSTFFGNAAMSGVSYAVVNEDDIIVSSMDKAHLGLTPEAALSLSPARYDELSLEGKLSMNLFTHNMFYAMSDEIGNGHAEWRVIMINPMKNANSSWRAAIATMIGFCAVACFLLLVASYMIARSISRPVNSLVDSIRLTAEQGTFQHVPDPGGGYEIDILYRAYNEMIAHIETLIEHINQEQEEKSNYKFQLIQAQIKPHFLYNTLMTIKSLIDLDMNEMAGECVYAMSSFYRLSLNKGNDILRLGDEVELSIQYMYIQKMRYIDRLDYIFDIPRNLNDYLIPKMTIQPILENAIYHGIKQKAGKGVIEVTGRDLGDCMEFTISDNGNGMSAQDLARLQASIRSNSGDIQPRNASFGLYSVNRRIQLLYGEEYGVHIDSCMGEYTIVTLTLPKITSFENENGGET